MTKYLAVIVLYQRFASDMDIDFNSTFFQNHYRFKYYIKNKTTELWLEQRGKTVRPFFIHSLLSLVLTFCRRCIKFVL
ncbi:hypothetical protein MFUM_940079 [Methylacidiphilum fumariolicum SolV]|uniref:Uncharacterized protein n=2 Tax=Candidatus Methylacidiphilum fumarolicum TaxID=591154 RepID=I0K135_METFB|nr:conserved protein of unknown function [Candidatus Methylacidiphilum fumarolicum]CCG93204.1 hypothetical protein MFUM_940079 [Methylacidiphilum fumariolicum SolV]